MPTSTTILGAAKLSGRPAGGWSVGVLDALTARERATVFDTTTRTYARDEVEPPANYLVGRVRRDLDAGNTSFGLLATAMDRWPDSPALDVLPTRAYAGGLHFFPPSGSQTHSPPPPLGPPPPPRHPPPLPPAPPPPPPSHPPPPPTPLP